MKKNQLFNYLMRAGWNKWVRNINITTLLILLFTANTSALFSQTTKISLKAENRTLGEIFSKIEAQSECRFFYQNEQIRDVNIKTLDVQNKNILDIVDELLMGTSLSYKLVDHNIIIFPKEENAGQQLITVSGRITDSSGEPLSGVTVRLKGIAVGTMTDEDGHYNLADIPADAILQFSFVGLISQEISVAGQTTINVVLLDDTVFLNEIVAIGYGKMKKADLTGSVISVDLSGKDMNSNVDLAQTLQGYLPGVNASAGSLAGQEGSLSIRGQTSLSASDEPLIVRDGIIFYGSFSEININDIEKIDILKDASAAAVYGNKSANGVIIITTKKGKTEKPMFNFNAYTGFQQLDNTVRDHMMNGDQYAIRLVDYYYTQELYNWYDTDPTSADGRPARADITDRTVVAPYLKTEEETNNYLAGNEINWVDKIFRTAPVQNYNLSVSGQTDRSNYYLSGSYMDQDGILENDMFKRSTMVVNFENKITDWMTIGLNASYAHLDYSGENADLNAGLAASPWADYFDDDGTLPQYLADESYMPHPLTNCYMVKSVDVQDKVNMVFTGKFEIPWIKGLSYEFNFAKYLNFAKVNKYTPAKVDANGGTAYKSRDEERDWSMNNIITYARTFDKHKITATYVYTREERRGEGSVLNAYLFDNETLYYNSMELGINQSVETSAWPESNLAYMGRLSYVYSDKYLLTATIRKDGYSAFGLNMKYGYFPSISLGWVLTKESFMKNADVIDYLKLRVSYGVNGNQGIGRYASKSQMSSIYYVYDGSTAVGLYSSSIGNANLAWEETGSYNLGLDYELLNHRISGEIDIYTSQTSNVLVKRTLAGISGYSSVWDNISGIKNKGIELGLTTVNISKSDLSWKTRFTFSINRNEITKLYGDATEDTGNGWFVGEPINSYYGYETDGIWQEQDLFDGTIIDGFYPGEYKLKDISGPDGTPDGIISAEYDRKILGTTDPNYRFSINNTITYKNFSLNFFINAIQGGNGYYQGSVSYIAGGTDQAYRVNRTAIRPYWTPFNPTNDTPAMYYSPSFAHYVLENKSFIRLQDVTLSYTFDEDVLSRWKINNAQVYLSGKNLYKLTECSAWDPERNSPMMRTVIAGIKMSF